MCPRLQLYVSRLPRGDDVLGLLWPFAKGSLSRDPRAARSAAARPGGRRAEPLLPRGDTGEQHLVRVRVRVGVRVRLRLRLRMRVRVGVRVRVRVKGEGEG